MALSPHLPCLVTTAPHGQNDAMVIPKLDIDGLTSDEKLTLIERIWDSLSSEDVGLPRAQRDELDRRLDDMEWNPPDDVTWTEAQRRIRERKR